MSIGRRTLVICTVTSSLSLSLGAGVRGQQAPAAEAPGQVVTSADEHMQSADGPLAQAVRRSTARLQDVESAIAAGYELSGGCVSGPEEGAMGVHYVNGPLVADGVLDETRPEVLVFEPQNGVLKLVAVEFIVLAEQWNAESDEPPTIRGQHFHFVP